MTFRRRHVGPHFDDRAAVATQRGWRRRRELSRERGPAGPTAGGRAADAAAGAVLLLIRIVRLVVSFVALIIVLGILFVVLGANGRNTIVSQIHDWAKNLAGPFDGMFHVHTAKATLALNWGIAIVVYLIIGSLVTRLVLIPTRPLQRRP